MPLTFQIVSRQRAEMGDEHQKTIGQEGATIGRSMDNDWVLPDTNRYVSSRHATVDFQAGCYYLIDTSTNGVYINGSNTPVGAGKPQRLFNGDKVSIGDYEMTTEITVGDELDSIEEMIASVVMEQAVEEAPDEDSPSMIEENELTGAQSLNARLFDEADTGTDTLASDQTAKSNIIDFGTSQSVVRSQPAASQVVNAAPAGNIVEDDLQLTSRTDAIKTGQSVRSSQSRAAQTSSSAQAPGGYRLKGEAGAQLEFLRGLGISIAELGNPDTNELMHNAGQALREFIIGTMDLLQTRASLKNAFRLEQTTIQAGANNPLKFSASIDDAIRNLLASKSRQYAPTVETVRDACRDLKIHEEALSNAARVAFDEFIDRLDPEELESRFDVALKRGSVFATGKKSKYWDLYAELYKVMTQRSSDQFPHTFSEEFVKAYEEYRSAAKRRLSDNKR